MGSWEPTRGLFQHPLTLVKLILKKRACGCWWPASPAPSTGLFSLWGQLTTHSYPVIPNCLALLLGRHLIAKWSCSFSIQKIQKFFPEFLRTWIFEVSLNLWGSILFGSFLLNVNWLYFPNLCKVNKLCQLFGRNRRHALTDYNNFDALFGQS